MRAIRPARQESQVSSLPEADDQSDYGSDIDHHVIDKLLSRAQSQPADDLVLTNIDQDPVTEHAIVHLRSSGQVIEQTAAGEWHPTSSPPVAATVEYSTPETILTSARQSRRPKPTTTEVDVGNNRSPLERFRTHPKKPLSVTDIVSPAWCEQQYLFSLSKHGRIRRTPAMKQGSKVHKVLEEQVHTTVRIEVKSREDMFALKLWNVIQGLRTLRETGLTRELEVWGLLDGQVVNGIIDELTSISPDPALEERILARQSSDKGRKSKKEKLEINQTTLAGFLTPGEKAASQVEEDKRHDVTRVYLVDVKTRQSRTVPAKDSRLRPVQMQLMLYHRLLSTLASGNVDKDAIFSRYQLDGSTVFSDTFVAEMSQLGLAYDNAATHDSLDELLANNTLNTLWQYMLAEFEKTLHHESTQLSPILTAEYRAADTGSLLGKVSFEFDAVTFDSYVEDELRWWKGERETKGVDIEEAFKCGMCEFAEECSWRKTKVEEAVQKTRQRKTTKERVQND